MTNTKEVLQAQFAALSKKIKAGTQAFNSKNFTASVRVHPLYSTLLQGGQSFA